MTPHELHDAHDRSFRNKSVIEWSAMCGCFSCMQTYSVSEIVEYVRRDQTAVCPHCGIDAVIGDASGLPVSDPKFLDEMNEFWFGRKEPLDALLGALLAKTSPTSSVEPVKFTTEKLSAIIHSDDE